jgi:hypothetical protein
MAGKNGGGIGGTAPSCKMTMSDMAVRAARDHSRGVWRRRGLVGPIYVVNGMVELKQAGWGLYLLESLL